MLADTWLRLTSAERGSEHPLGESIVRSTQARGLTRSEPANFEGIAGYGIAAEVEGQQILLGNQRLMAQRGVALNELLPKAVELQNQAKTVMWLAVDGEASALIGVAETVKEGSSDPSVSEIG